MPLERIRPGSDRTHGLTSQPRGDRAASNSSAGAFRDQLERVQSVHLNERIDRALAQIDQLGNRLAEGLSMAELKRYRQAVGALLKDLTDNMIQVKTNLEWDTQSWEHRSLITIRRVDEELERLTEMVLSQEKDRLAILAKIGEIKGMLLDVRM